MDKRLSEQQAAEEARKAISEALRSSGEHQATEARLANATGRICFAIFAFSASLLLFLFGFSVQETQPLEGVITKIVSAVLFVGGSWHLHCAQKAHQDHAKDLQRKADEVARKARSGLN